jgi:hypothetical protein
MTSLGFSGFLGVIFAIDLGIGLFYVLDCVDDEPLVSLGSVGILELGAEQTPKLLNDSCLKGVLPGLSLIFCPNNASFLLLILII